MQSERFAYEDALRSFCYIQGMGIKGLFNGIKGKIEDLRKKGKPEVRAAEDGTRSVRLSDEAFSLLCALAEELGPRPAASQQSRQAARRIASEMGKHTDDVTLTTGRIFPFVGRSMKIFLHIFTLASIVLAFIGLPYLSLAAIALYLYAFYGEVMKSGGWLRTFMATDEAANVHAVIESEDEAERTIIFSAHHDSAPLKKETDGKPLDFISSRYLQPSVLACVFILTVISIVNELMRGVFWAFNLPSIPVIILLLAAAGLTVLSFMSLGKDDSGYSPGAGDNLSGVSVVVTLLSYFANERKNGRGLRKTRLVFVSFDGEECGREGSKLWYRDNAYLLGNAENLNFDGIYDEKDLAFLTMDGNGFVPLSSNLALRCSSIASAMGYKTATGKLGFLSGESDAASAALSSIDATTLTSMASGHAGAAHTSDDIPDKVSEEALSRAIAIGIRLAKEEDGKEGEKEASVFDGERKYKLSRY